MALQLDIEPAGERLGELLERGLGDRARPSSSARATLPLTPPVSAIRPPDSSQRGEPHLRRLARRRLEEGSLISRIRLA